VFSPFNALDLARPRFPVRSESATFAADGKHVFGMCALEAGAVSHLCQVVLPCGHT
jgi:hypothetical protein